MFKDDEKHETCYCESCLELQQKLEQKEQKYEELKKGVIKQCPICGEQFLNNVGAELYEKNTRLKQALDEIKKICQIKEENSQFVLPSVWQQILDIIHETKEK